MDRFANRWPWLLAIAAAVMVVGCGEELLAPTGFKAGTNLTDAQCRAAFFSLGATSGPSGGATGKHWECDFDSPGWVSGSRCDSDEVWLEIDDSGESGAAGCIPFDDEPDLAEISAIGSGSTCVVGMDGLGGILDADVSAGSIIGTFVSGNISASISCNLVTNP